MRGMGGGLGDIAAGMNEPAELHGLKKPEVLSPPKQVAFGTYRERLRYQAGCIPADELATYGVDVVSCQLSQPGGERVVLLLTPTPQAYDPRRNGQPLPNAGTPNDLVMVTRLDREVAANQFTYVDPTEITGMVAKIGGGLAFAQGPNRDRPLEVPGAIENVTGFRRPV